MIKGVFPHHALMSGAGDGEGLLGVVEGLADRFHQVRRSFVDEDFLARLKTPRQIGRIGIGRKAPGTGDFKCAQVQAVGGVAGL